MKQATFTEEQMVYAMRQAEAGAPVGEVCRKLGMSEQTFYRWKKKFAGSDNSISHSKRYVGVNEA